MNNQPGTELDFFARGNTVVVKVLSGVGMNK